MMFSRATGSKINQINRALTQRAREFSNQIEHSSFTVLEVMPSVDGKTSVKVHINTGGEFGVLRADKLLHEFLTYNDFFGIQLAMTPLEENIAIFTANIPLNDLTAKIIKRTEETKALFGEHLAPEAVDTACVYIKQAIEVIAKRPALSLDRSCLETSMRAGELVVSPRPGSGWSLRDTQYLAKDFAEHFGLDIRHGGFPATRDGSIYISGSPDTILAQLSSEAAASTLTDRTKGLTK